jgi:phosphatidylglycerol---prolipoprotein diacylglyceryl transferase
VYADFAEFFRRVLGLDLPALSLFKAFGFLVAIAFFAGGYVWFLEIKRKGQQGLIGKGEIKTFTINTKIDYKAFALQAMLGLLVGYKVGGLFLSYNTSSADPLNYLASFDGNYIGALIGALLFTLLKYSDLISLRKQYGITEQPIVKQMRTAYHYRVGDLALVAALAGFAGAKVFSAFEDWSNFIKDPIGNFFSSSGLTFYGGLIMATLCLLLYTSKWQLKFKHLCDAAAPALILAYAIGRLGCQVSGDGDWGIHNSAYVTNVLGEAVPAKQADAFVQAQQQYQNYFSREFGANKPVPYAHFSRPAALSFLPHWLFAYSYSHNVNGVGVPLQNCDGNYCTTLPVPVFPTPLYEFVAGVLIFILLWSLRKRFSYPLDMFGTYLIFNGVERYCVESIRVNTKLNYGLWQPTQAELIALILIVCGIGLLAYNRIMKPKPELVQDPQELHHEQNLQT